jgi:hypothetical protein
MLDDVERRRLVVEPARKDPAELALRIPDVELDEGAGKLLRLPRRGGFASPQPNDHVAGPDGLPRLQGEVLLDPVALIEQADDGDPFRHRRRPGRDFGDPLGDVARRGFGACLGVALHLILRSAAAAAGERGEAREREDDRPERQAHAPSGLQAS